MSKCCIYCRVANKSTMAHSAAMHEQLLSLRAAAEKLGLEVVKEFCWFERPNDANRVSMRQIIDGGEAGDYDCVLVANPGRLARDTHVMDEIGKAFHKAGLKVYTPEGEAHITTPVIAAYLRVGSIMQLQEKEADDAVQKLEDMGYDQRRAEEIVSECLNEMVADGRKNDLAWYIERAISDEAPDMAGLQLQ